MLNAVFALAMVAARPNIVFILTDDQRFDAAGYLGHPIVKTPHIDKLASRSVRFRNSFATTPICAASRASLLTGSYERTHRYTFGTKPLAKELCENSYPATLRRAGYRTALFGKVGVNYEAGEAPKMFDKLKSYVYPYVRKTADGGTRHIDEMATDDALAFIDSQPKGQPFCLSISYNSPHAQDGVLDDLYPAPQSVAGMYQDTPIPQPPMSEGKYFDELPTFLQKAMNRVRWYWQFDTREKYIKNMRAYYRMVSGIDVEVGRVLTKLDDLGLQRDTVVIFMSDNGYFIGERGLSGKWVHFEESLRVPLLIYDPRQKARSRDVQEMALNIDVAPTILEMAGVTPGQKYQGKSLYGLVKGEKMSWRKDFFCEHLMKEATIPKWEGVRGSRYVYARYFEQNPPFEFLHDLQTDPHETKNLANDPGYSKQLKMMRSRLGEMKKSYGGEATDQRTD